MEPIHFVHVVVWVFGLRVWLKMMLVMVERMCWDFVLVNELVMPDSAVINVLKAVIVSVH